MTEAVAAARPPVALPKREGDERLRVAELAKLSLFSSLKKQLSFKKFPGATVLRRFEKREIVCRQNDAGETAFYILTDTDTVALRRGMIEDIDTVLSKDAGSKDGGTKSDRKALAARRTAYEKEVAELEAMIQSRIAAGTRPDSEPVAMARLQVDLRRDDRRGPLRRFVDRMLGLSLPSTALPRSIPIDGVSDIDSDTLSAPMFPGEIFGEMSCMNRAPRSATVIVARDCYMLEMQRHILDQLHRDADYQVKMDEMYKRRVLEVHIRRLSIFEDLTDQEYQSLFQPLETERTDSSTGLPVAPAPAPANQAPTPPPGLELVNFNTGTVIFDEGDASDCFYIVRSGVVQVAINSSSLFIESDFSEPHWIAFNDELLASAQTAGYGPHVSRRLQEIFAGEGGLPPAGSAASTDVRARIVRILNQFITTTDLHRSLSGKKKRNLLAIDSSPALERAVAAFPEETEEWSGLESRSFHRAALELVFPNGVPKLAHCRRGARIIAYCSRGDCIGEMGVFLDRPRSATCVAYDHPRGGQELPGGATGAVLPNVELVKINRNTFRRLLEMSPKIRARVEEIVRQRQREIELRGQPRPEGSWSDTIPDELGLFQGQKLMLIDLERCTRCGLCVDACVDAHPDGRTRLYLDGPRFDKYLVPSTCRKCLNPVCMVGCPVGAINRGENGEIQIRDWCIGCDLCAKQCPYGAIQMSFRDNQVTFMPDELEPGVQVEPVEKQAVVCDLCSSLPKRDPACVYVCPHDAALRVSAQEFLLQPNSRT